MTTFPSSSLAEDYAAALTVAAQAKSEAHRLERHAKRVWAQCFLSIESGSVEHKKAQATIHEAYKDIEEKLIKAETEANISKAKADGFAARLDEWRTLESTKRAEMGMR